MICDLCGVCPPLARKDFNNLVETTIHMEGKTKDGKEVKTKENKYM